MVDPGEANVHASVWEDRHAVDLRGVRIKVIRPENWTFYRLVPLKAIGRKGDPDSAMPAVAGLVRADITLLIGVIEEVDHVRRLEELLLSLVPAPMQAVPGKSDLRPSRSKRIDCPALLLGPGIGDLGHAEETSPYDIVRRRTVALDYPERWLCPCDPVDRLGIAGALAALSYGGVPHLQLPFVPQDRAIQVRAEPFPRTVLLQYGIAQVLLGRVKDACEALGLLGDHRVQEETRERRLAGDGFVLRQFSCLQKAVASTGHASENDQRQAF